MPDRMLTLRDMSLIDAIASAGSISGAARMLDLSQPALSRRVVELEGRIGMVLVLRGSRGSAPTIAGARLLEAMTLVADQLHQALESARDAPPLHAGDVLIGLPVATPLRRHLHDVILAVAREEPATHILTSQIPFLRQQAAVRQGILDVGFGLEPNDVDDPLEACALVWRGALDVVLVPSWHALARKTVVALRDLSGERIGVPDEVLSPDFARRMRAALVAASFRGVVESTPQDVTRDASDVARGERLAMVSSTTVPDAPGVVSIPLEQPLMIVHTYVYWRKHAPLRVRSFVRRLGVVDPATPAS